MIDVRHLRYALAAAETGSFSRAAGRFRVKQSTLSKRIKHLELRLGMSLFDRSAQGVAPTPVGSQFLDRARSIIGDLESLAEESRALAKGSTGRLRIGFQGSLCSGGLRAIFDAYRCNFPDVELEACEASRETLLAHVDYGQLDLAIVAGGIGSAEHRTLCLWSEPVTIAMASGHRLEKCAPIYWTDLRGLTFMVTATDPGPLIASMIGARLTGAGSAPKIVSRSVGQDNLMSFVRGDCVAVTTASFAIAKPVILLREVHDAFGPARLDQSLYWREGNANPALRQFLLLAAERYGRPLSADS